MTAQQVVPVSCPSCNGRFNAPYQSIIDGQNQMLKAAYLNGRLNVAQCPQCGAVFPLQAPLFYYDLGKELAFVFVPNGLSMTMEEQSQIVGRLTNPVVNSLPNEQKKFYLMNPKIFLSIESMLDEILEADGITAEMRAKQKASIALLQEFLKLDNEEAIKTKATEQADALDRTFFEVLTNTMQSAQMEGNQQFSQVLLMLRTLLAEINPEGGKIVDEIDEELGLVILKGREDLLERLRKATDTETFEHLMAMGHSLLDYQFFVELTQTIETATKNGQSEEAYYLTELRKRILDTKAKQEAEAQAAYQKSAELLQQIFQSANPQQILADNLDKLDDTFFALLANQIQQAQQQQQTEAVQAMEMVAQMALQMLQEQIQEPAPSEPTPPPTPTIEIATR